MVFSLLGLAILGGALAFGWEIYNGPVNHVAIGMTLPESLRSTGNITGSNLTVTEVPLVDAKLMAQNPDAQAHPKQYYIAYRDDKYTLGESQLDEIKPIGSFGTLDELGADLQNRLAHHKDSSWHVTVMCKTSPVSHTAFGYLLGADLRVYYVSATSYRGP